MCEAYPVRREELDLYLQLVVKISTTFPGPIFYEYHKLFSAHAATQILKGKKLDWSAEDKHIFNHVTSGHKVTSCEICGSLTHKTKFCPSSMATDKTTDIYTNTQGQINRTARPSQSHRSTRSDTDKLGRPLQYFMAKQICNNYNSDKGCSHVPCRFEHVCLQCKGMHSMTMCGQGDNTTDLRRVISATASNVKKQGSASAQARK
jgi:hypothetical protein